MVPLPQSAASQVSLQQIGEYLKIDWRRGNEMVHY